MQIARNQCLTQEKTIALKGKNREIQRNQKGKNREIQRNQNCQQIFST